MEEKLLEEWKERLGLQDWLIILQYNCKREDFNLDDVDGEVTVLHDSKQAIVRILKPELFEGITDFDFEQTLVHELLHCKFDILDYYSKSYDGEVTNAIRHQLLDDLARAFVMAKRGGTKRKLAENRKVVENMACENRL